ncbi:MAG: hypothetical protein ACTJGD_11160 [Mesonia hippocampi]|uniref:hypothetical protein n=1 Tax=Mesonia hippocampi TaxID=1628250 RepID=UPI003F9BC38E
MIIEDAYMKQKQAVFQTFQNTTEIEKAFQLLKAESLSKLETSLLSKFAHEHSNTTAPKETKVKIIKQFCKKLMGHSVSFDSFNNSELGTVFIAGPLVTIFLREVSGKPLAAMSSGPYGIFRGLGATEAQATQLVKTLSSGSYVLIFRGYKKELHLLEDKLKQ